VINFDSIICGDKLISLNINLRSNSFLLLKHGTSLVKSEGQALTHRSLPKHETEEKRECQNWASAHTEQQNHHFLEYHTKRAIFWAFCITMPKRLTPWFLSYHSGTPRVETLHFDFLETFRTDYKIQMVVD